MPAPMGASLIRAPEGARGAVAQMGERCNRTAEVVGSIPIGSTMEIKDLSEIENGDQNAGYHGDTTL